MASHHSWQSLLNPGGADDFFQASLPVGFDPTARDFRRINAWWLSELCRLIYRRGPREQQTPGSETGRDGFLQRVRCKERHFFDAGVVQAALVETTPDAGSPFAVLVFRGSIGRREVWLSHLRIGKAPWPAGGRVHRGFRELFDKLWPMVFSRLETVRSPLYFTGHSLGGAMATLAASLHPVQAVYTFGAPRVGDLRFAQSLSKAPLFRVVNRPDIVQLLPPSLPPFGYRHAGIRHTVETLPLLEGRPGTTVRPAPPAFLASHAPAAYSAQLR
jgi:hypothetical protein